MASQLARAFCPPHLRNAPEDRYAQQIQIQMQAQNSGSKPVLQNTPMSNNINLLPRPGPGIMVQNSAPPPPAGDMFNAYMAEQNNKMKSSQRCPPPLPPSSISQQSQGHPQSMTNYPRPPSVQQQTSRQMSFNHLNQMEGHTSGPLNNNPKPCTPVSTSSGQGNKIQTGKSESITCSERSQLKQQENFVSAQYRDRDNSQMTRKKRSIQMKSQSEERQIPRMESCPCNPKEQLPNSQYNQSQKGQTPSHLMAPVTPLPSQPATQPSRAYIYGNSMNDSSREFQMASNASRQVISQSRHAPPPPVPYNSGTQQRTPTGGPWYECAARETCYGSDTDNGDRYEEGSQGYAICDENCECYSDDEEYCENGTDDEQQCDEYETECCNQGDCQTQDYSETKNRDDCQCRPHNQNLNVECSDKVQVVIQIPQQVMGMQPKPKIQCTNSLQMTKQIPLPTGNTSNVQARSPLVQQNSFQMKPTNAGTMSNQPSVQVINPCCLPQRDSNNEHVNPCSTDNCETDNSNVCNDNSCTEDHCNEHQSEPCNNENSSVNDNPAKENSCADIQDGIITTCDQNMCPVASVSGSQTPIVLLPQNCAEETVGCIEEEIKIFYNPNSFDIRTFLESVQNSKLIYYPPPQSFDPISQSSSFMPQKQVSPTNSISLRPRKC